MVQMHSPRCSVCTSKVVPVDQSRFTLSDRYSFEHEVLNPKELFVFPRLSKLAGEELSALQARNFSSAGDISAHASGVRVLVLRVLKAAVSLTKAKGGKQDQVSRLTPMPFLTCVSACKHHSYANTTAMRMYAPRHHIKTARKQRLRTVCGSDWRRAHTE